MLLSVLICFYGKKISVSEFLRSARSSFLLFLIKKENRQRLYNLLSIFILKLINSIHFYMKYMNYLCFCSSLLYTLSLNSVYTTDTNGIKISIPTTPIKLPPIVTAASTHMEGRPTEFPTTFG